MFRYLVLSLLYYIIALPPSTQVLPLYKASMYRAFLDASSGAHVIVTDNTLCISDGVQTITLDTDESKLKALEEAIAKARDQLILQ